jgi:beta-galactosidase
MRERISLDQNWRFALGHAANAALDFEYARDRSLVKAGEARGAAGYKFEDGKWKQVNVPHDWAIELPFVKSEDREAAEHGFRKMGPDHPETSVGWYRRTFKIPKGDLGRRISIAFDGVFRDSIVWVNGFRMGRHPDGTTPFRYDITDVVKYGEDNVIAVRCDITHYEGWWYEGGGIYRHVWLVKTDPLHIAPDGVCVRTELAGKKATVSIVTKITNESDDAKEIELVSEITDSAGKAVAAVKPVKLAIAPWTEIETEQSATINNPALWSPEQPNLYRVKQSLKSGKTETDAVETIFGVRTFKFDAKRGFLLNGQPYKIQGTCNHHQHAGVGTAMPDRLHEFRVEKLKELGSNAYRCSHYCATPELLDICDRLGMLVLAENRLAGSSDEVLGQFATMIVRDRNHASIFGWSLANEEHTVQWAIAGERIGKTMVRLAHRLDPTRIVTTAMHDRGLGAGFANVVDVHGWNYLKVGDLEAFHKRRPDQPILGSEEASTVCTRGIYTDDAFARLRCRL